MLKFVTEGEEGAKIVGLGFSYANLDLLKQSPIMFTTMELELGERQFLIARSSTLDQATSLLETDDLLIVLSDADCKSLINGATLQFPLNELSPDLSGTAICFAGENEYTLVDAMKQSGLLSADTVSDGSIGAIESTHFLRKGNVFEMWFHATLVVGMAFMFLAVGLSMSKPLPAYITSLICALIAIPLFLALRGDKKIKLELGTDGFRMKNLDTTVSLPWHLISFIDPVPHDARLPLVDYKTALLIVDGQYGEQFRIPNNFTGWKKIVSVFSQKTDKKIEP